LEREKDFSHYSTLRVHFYDLDVPKLLEWVLLEKSSGHFNLLDLGCCDGRLLFILQTLGLLNNVDRIVGVDISPTRVRRFVQNINGSIGIVSDACKVEELDDGSFDIIICSQLIEHVNNDYELLKEIHRLLREDGLAYISSVIRRPYAFWFYRHDGKFWLDPTHIREYSSKKDFLRLLERYELIPRKIHCSKVKYSITDLVMRAFIIVGLYNPETAQNAFVRHKYLARFRKAFKFPVLGYDQIEVIASVRTGQRKL